MHSNIQFCALFDMHSNIQFCHCSGIVFFVHPRTHNTYSNNIQFLTDTAILLFVIHTRHIFLSFVQRHIFVDTQYSFFVLFQFLTHTAILLLFIIHISVREEAPEHFSTYLTILYSELKKFSTELNVQIKLNVLPVMYSPSSDVSFEIIDSVNRSIVKFNTFAETATFMLNNFLVQRVHSGKFGNVVIEGKEFFSPAHVWVARNSNHLSRNVLQSVLLDLKRHFDTKFQKQGISIEQHVTMKYILDSSERSRFLQSSKQKHVVNCSVFEKQTRDVATQTEGFSYKRVHQSEKNVGSRLEEARQQAKKKRDEDLKKAFSILQYHDSDVSSLQDLMSNSRCTDDVASQLSDCTLSE